MNIACPECSTIYRVDPSRVPDDGAVARCRECGTVFRVDPDQGSTEPGEFLVAPRWEPAEEAGAAEAPAPERGSDTPEREPRAPDAPAFGPQDPDTRARRLARALVSDIKVYHPDRWAASAEAGTLRSDFRDEIMKSWEEYVEQVGEEMARQTPYFRDALNQILARGERVF
jgi:predicted Zn finger-like uncharacterized protein